ncbi:MAG: acetyl-CoA carboxylase, carboxyl transferase, beta subunit [Bacteroidetes bacterium]|uniref:acetyl-CoA carboxylase, carboxyltransferase subunit beta n=1 Tax=unclassified Chitinophaga TaxID=2619133 RepID=UPI0009D286A6|nr:MULTISPECIES: acetyl-CoA carboxylase, carboxyltransferase subunit beta [unclassified Chitinophaga]MBP1652733.1 acetyl-CoA carboxylase, carboxyl transferase, beta subunit [Bacteroidota bacterium]OMP76034.1 acetyl-CoA carboxylase subunit beta [[Flexibacter] sp. ATCC 35208]WPV65157.1 acetyl-CoA carboxylase, carboxyltransferase subunit beta [Chitinophaga sp. LS1]
MSSWFKRIKQGIQTSTSEKKEAPDGLWHKCPSCKKTVTVKDLKDHFYVCDKCNYHNRIDSAEYFEILFDNNQFEELFPNIYPKDFLGFKDLKPYGARLIDAQKKSGLKDAMRVGVGKVFGNDLVVSCMDFAFIGGSMGSVVGEKIARSIDYCIAHKMPLMIISKSGGARMMESAFSLMQMAKTSAKLTQLADAKLPFISLATDPTTGGVTASFAMLGDLNIAEPKALIGFAGPRIIKETIKKDLPEGFQSAEFLLEHGFLDLIIDRKEMKAKLAQLLELFKN